MITKVPLTQNETHPIVANFAKLNWIVMVIGIFVLSNFNSLQKANAAIPREISKMVPDEVLYAAKFLHLPNGPIIDWNNLVPDGVQNMSGGQALAAIADRGVNQWWKSDSVRSSLAGQTVSKVEGTLKQDIDLGGQAVNHRLRIQMLAFQTQARLEYSGLANAAIFYNAADASSGLEIAQTMSPNKAIVLSHTERANQNLSQISLRIGF
jgi:hypothetical protein